MHSVILRRLAADHIEELVSRAASLAYPIRDGIPIMLEEEARQLDEGEMRAVNRR